jgi:hypothetical protein
MDRPWWKMTRGFLKKTKSFGGLTLLITPLLWDEMALLSLRRRGGLAMTCGVSPDRIEITIRG